MKPSFIDWLAAKLGTRAWFVGRRWSRKTRTEYSVLLTPKRFQELKAEYEAAPCST